MRAIGRAVVAIAVSLGYGYGGIALAEPATPYAGPFVPNKGMQITTVFANKFGRDADSVTLIERVTPSTVALRYTSTRGIAVDRNILVRDRDNATAYVLGYSPNMPTTIPGTTSMGISAAVLSRLRSSGSAPLTLVYSQRLDRIDCTLTAKGVDVKVALIIEDRVADIQIVDADVLCGSGDKTGTGRLLIANDVNNPIVVGSTMKFSWESRPRVERVTRVSAGPGQRNAMEQALNTLGTYDVYGLHFEFDKATLRPSARHLVRDIATTLKNNPNWVIQITGHTDNIGGTSYNERLSSERANAVRQALIRQGIPARRLKAVGFGETHPKADNGTMEGRAINRRVELRRLDR